MKKFILFGILFISFMLIFITIPARADSGWDSSYDSGGSSWSSSSSSSSSSWSSSDGSSGSSELNLGEAIFMEVFVSIHYMLMAFIPIGEIIGGVKKSKQIAILLFVIRALVLIFADIFISPYIAIFDFIFLFVLVFIVVPCLARFFNKNGNYIDMSTSFYDVDKNELLNYNIDNLDNLKNKLYNNFIAVQEAWMNFDYDRLRELCTDELYNSYKSQLDVLKLKNGQNIMSDFVLLDSKIFAVKQEGMQLIVDVYMKISFYDYVIDTTNKKVTRGNKRKKLTNNYVMTFVKSNSNNDNLIHCPNCNAKVYVNASGECEYCGSVIVKDAGEFVLSKKINING